MTRDEIIQHFKAAGRNGMSVEHAVRHLEEADMDRAMDLAEEANSAHAEGWEERIEATWTTRWTTAPESYDGFGTRGAVVGVYYKKPLRRVKIDPRHLEWQEMRYASGMMSAMDEAKLRELKGAGLVTLDQDVGAKGLA